MRLTVNGVPRAARVPARRLLSDFLRHDLRLTGTHVGCEHGVCGACTVLLDGEPVRSCLLLAVTVDGHEVTTVEGLGGVDDMHPVQQAFRECHGLQCGFCTPGFLTTVAAYLEDNPDPTEAEAREAISGNLCRCTGYQNIVASVLRAAEIDRARRAGGRAAVTTKLFGEPVQRVEDAKLVTGGAHFLDDLGQDALGGGLRAQPARPRPGRRHRRHRRRSRSTGWSPSTPTTTWCCRRDRGQRGGRAAAAADPAPRR